MGVWRTKQEMEAASGDRPVMMHRRLSEKVKHHQLVQ